MLRGVSAAIAAGFLFSCSSSPEAPRGTVTGITVSTGDLSPAFSPDTYVYTVSSLTTLVPVDITVTGQDVTIDGDPAQDGVPHATQVTQLDDPVSIHIDATDAQGNPVRYNIRTVPPVRPRYDVTVSGSPTPGLVFLTPAQLAPVGFGPSFLYILDETGALVYYARTQLPVTDFARAQYADGTVRYTYHAPDQGLSIATWPVLPGSVTVLDDHFQPLENLRILPSATHGAWGIDGHEFRLLADDHWIADAYLGETVTGVPRQPIKQVVSCVVQEVSGGNVVFDWESASDPDLFVQSSDHGLGFDEPPTAPWADEVHLNSIDFDPANGNVLVSLRHDDELVELDHATRAVVWTLGGVGDDFGLAPADKFSHQHFARFVAPNDITLFDNGNAAGVTKIREYQIDPAAHTAQVLAALALDGHYSSAMGSVQKLGNRYFVGWGYHVDGKPDITELDATTQEKSFELTFRDGYISYRALKYPR